MNENGNSTNGAHTRSLPHTHADHGADHKHNHPHAKDHKVTHAHVAGYRFTWYVGQGFRADGTPLNDAGTKRTEALVYLLKRYGGVTAALTGGYWTNEQGEIHAEDTWVVTVFTPEPPQSAYDTANVFRSIFAHSSVLVEVAESSYDFVDGPRHVVLTHDHVHEDERGTLVTSVDDLGARDE